MCAAVARHIDIIRVVLNEDAESKILDDPHRKPSAFGDLSGAMQCDEFMPRLAALH